MEYIKEENKNLISLRASIITVMIVLTGGILGLTLSSNVGFLKFTVLLVIGIYFDIVFLMNVLNINEKIKENIRRMKNELA